MNGYVTVDKIISEGILDIDPKDTNILAVILAVIEDVSRQLDAYIGRHFYEHVRTQTFDGDGGIDLTVPDLISVTTLKTDENLDGTYEVTWATTDYYLLPNNSDPATRLNPQSKPYTLIERNPNGTRYGFPSGRQGVEIVGSWGYWKHLKVATETANTISDTTTTTVTASARTDIEQGHTILIDSEQMFVKSYNGDALTVERGVNGTTAATHSNNAPISIYEYPEPLVRATIGQAGRILRRSQSGFVNTLGFENGAATGVGNRMDIDVRQMLDPYRLYVMA